MKGIPPIIFALFIGPWSDKFGRKFLIIFPLFGYVLYDLWFLVNVIYFDELVVEYLMLEIVQYWFGGFMCMFLGENLAQFKRIILTEVAGEGGTDCPPQKFLSSQKFRHLMG